MNARAPDGDGTSVEKTRLVRMYDEIAPTYGTKLDMIDIFGRDLIATARLGAGDRVLDIACGRGACLRPAAETVGEDGFVLGADISRQMISLLAQDLQTVPRCRGDLEAAD